jgi:hypothetical protein
VSYFVAGWSVATTTRRSEEKKKTQPAAAATVSVCVRGVDDVSRIGRVSGLADEKSASSRNQSSSHQPSGLPGLFLSANHASVTALSGDERVADDAVS